MERIYEMANRRKRQTGLPINIWIDENGWYKLSGHGKRIKVQMNYGEKNAESAILLHRFVWKYY